MVRTSNANPIRDLFIINDDKHSLIVYNFTEHRVGFLDYPIEIAEYCHRSQKFVYSF